MPVVQISLRAGRDTELKRTLIAEVTNAVVRVTGVNVSKVRVLLYELPSEHWGLGGTTAGEPTRHSRAAKPVEPVQDGAAQPGHSTGRHSLERGGLPGRGASQ